jgi:thioredoxin-related protein
MKVQKSIKISLVVWLASVLLSSYYLKTNNNSLQEKAKTSQKNIVVYFSGSDWCSVCHKFKKSLLAQPKVDSLLNSNYVYYVADFPQRSKLDAATTELNEALAERLNPEGVFPLLVIADEQLNIKESITARTPESESLQKLNQHKK